MTLVTTDEEEEYVSLELVVISDRFPAPVSVSLREATVVAGEFSFSTSWPHFALHRHPLGLTTLVPQDKQLSWLAHGGRVDPDPDDPYLPGTWTFSTSLLPVTLGVDFFASDGSTDDWRVSIICRDCSVGRID